MINLPAAKRRYEFSSSNVDCHATLAIEGRYHALIARSAMTLRSEDGLAGVRGAIDIIVPMAQDTMA
ncbi:MAG TPA: hypothetical protein VNZ53_14285, partial [Steroidobacteraceae bacterium]|nr:hypothetical protein [Steroidobacteraceae bacterium]